MTCVEYRSLKKSEKSSKLMKKSTQTNLLLVEIKKTASIVIYFDMLWELFFLSSSLKTIIQNWINSNSFRSWDL